LSSPSVSRARVVRAERSSCLVALDDRLLPARCSPALVPAPTVGDYVAIANAAIVAVHPRTTAIVRADASGRSTGQVLAANVDVLLVCTPLSEQTRLSRVERLLALAWASGARPVIVATKADECDGPDAALAQLVAAAPGVEVIATSVVTGAGLDRIGELAGPGITVAALGASGVGKSSLANALLGDAALRVDEIRSDGKGRHTTAWRELRALPTGGAFIDTPGLRAVGLYDAEDGVRRVFADLEALAAQCRFTDCRHETEPDCAVLAAVTRGEVDPHRVQRQRKLERELEWQQAKVDARLRAERARRWKTIARARRALDYRP
jgi:ribosome biogenesis GTPase